ncbi:MAG: MFS transporter [Ramlibacter sp.]|nr:MFS transporter [Ramlibacter sp.]
MPGILYLFALTNLVIGTGAFVLTGIVQPVADSLGVSVAAAGQAMTAHALASALFAPLLLLATGRWPRKRALMTALGLIAVGGAMCASAQSLAMLLAGRTLMGVGSVFSALVAGVVVAVTEPARRGRALSVAFLGVSLSYAFGLPLGTWLGFTYGWQVPVWLTSGACVVMMGLLYVLLPGDIKAPGASFAGLGAAARQWPILRVWLRTMLYFIAIFSVFSYVGPVMLALNPLTPGQLSFTLAMFGLSGVAGTLIAGRAVDRIGPVRTSIAQLTVLSMMMVLVPLTAGHHALTVVVFVAWGISGFGLMVPQQLLLAAYAPQQAPLLMSLTGSMLYIGTALGAAISGAFIGTIGFARLSWVGLPFALLALSTLWFDTRRRAA